MFQSVNSSVSWINFFNCPFSSRTTTTQPNDLGGIGLEELRKKYPELAGMDYDSQGRYLKFLEAEKKLKEQEKQSKKSK